MQCTYELINSHMCMLDSTATMFHNAQQQWGFITRFVLTKGGWVARVVISEYGVSFDRFPLHSMNTAYKFRLIIFHQKHNELDLFHCLYLIKCRMFTHVVVAWLVSSFLTKPCSSVLFNISASCVLEISIAGKAVFILKRGPANNRSFIF